MLLGAGEDLRAAPVMKRAARNTPRAARDMYRAAPKLRAVRGLTEAAPSTRHSTQEAAIITTKEASRLIEQAGVLC